MANITTQTIRLDLNTGKNAPIAYTHQNDTARTFVFSMYLNGEAYTMTGHTVKFAYMSPLVNGQYTVIAGSNMATGTVSGNTVTVSLPTAYTRISGVGLLTMIITPSSGTIRPVNIKLVVHRSADGDDTVAGASDLPDAFYEVAREYYSQYVTEEVAEIRDLVASKVDSFTGALFSTANKRLSPTGTVVDSNGDYITDFIPCSEGDTVKWKGKSFIYQGESVMSLVAFYDGTGNFISSVTSINNETTNTEGEVEAVAPAGATYVRASTHTLDSSYYFHVFNVHVSDLIKIKSIENKIAFDFSDFFEVGNMGLSTSGWSYSATPKRVRTRENLTISLKKGDKIGLSSYSGNRYYIGGLTVNHAYIDSGWLTSDYVAPADGNYVVLIDTVPHVDQTSASGLAGLFFAPMASIIENLQQKISNISTSANVDFDVYSGFIGGAGAIGAADAEKKEVYTSKIPVSNGAKITFDIQFETSKAMWIAYALYDENDGFISRTVLRSGVDGNSYNAQITINESSAAYISFTYRSYGTATVTINLPSFLNAVYKIFSNKTEILSGKLYNSIKSVNHRGYNTIAPENTLPAYVLSRKNGFDYVETDVSFTSDGVPVLLHDNTINRTARLSDGSQLTDTISINDITYNQALDYDFGIYKSSEYAGTKIPTLRQFMVLCRGLGLHPYLDLKSGFTQAQIEGLVDIVKECGMLQNTTWIASGTTYQEYIKAKAPKARLGVLAEGVTDAAVTMAQSLKTNDNDVFIDASSYTAEDVAKCIAGGIPMEVWTVNSAETIIGLDPYITGVTSDSAVASMIIYNSMI